MTDAQTTFARATLEYDKAHERALMEAITRTIFESSTVSDANAIVIRTGEAAEALLTVLAGILAMSPAATRSPTAIRRDRRRARQAASPADRRGRAECGSYRNLFAARFTAPARKGPHDAANPPPAPGRRDLRPAVLEPARSPSPSVSTPDGTPGEVFIDGGKTGQDVAVNAPATPRSWCRWRFSTELASPPSGMPLRATDLNQLPYWVRWSIALLSRIIFRR